MTEILQAIQDCDARALEVEKAREAVETAKAVLEAAKATLENCRAQFDEALTRGEDVGLPKAKMKKLIEERTAALVASGLVPTQNESLLAAKPRVAKAPKKKNIESSESPSDTASDFEMNVSEDEGLAALNPSLQPAH